MRWVVLLGLLFACAPPHRTFPAPPPNVTPEQRVEGFNRYVASKEHWISQNGLVTRHSVIMQDGTEVYYPEDLVPLVGDDSSTAKHARASIEARAKRRTWTYVMVGAWLAGGVIVVKTFPDTNTLTDIGYGLLVGGLVAYGVSMYYYFEHARETRAAYEGYDDDLAARLKVCVAGLQIVPCEFAQQQGSPPPSTGNGGYYGTTPTKQ